MEFHEGSYVGRLTLNPSDLILRLEHKESFRLYEHTFFERDFVEYSALGGIEFVGRILSLSYQPNKRPDGVTVTLAEAPSKLNMTLLYESPLFPSPLKFQFLVPAMKKQTGGTDLDTMNRKLEQIQRTMEARVAPLLLKLQELEERCGSTIALSGCDSVIPLSCSTLTLVRHETMLPSGHAFTLLVPKRTLTGQSPNWTNPASQGWSTYETYGFKNHYIHTGILSIAPLKYLKDCTSLTLSGTAEIKDYSPLGELTNLTSLSIVSSRAFNPSNPSFPNGAGQNPPLTDISWIKHLTKLTSINFLGCSQLVDITPLKNVPNLRTLDIRETGVKTVDFLSVSNPHLTITK